MGRERVELTAHAGLSNHNSAQDDADARLWNEFIARVQELAADPRYADIDLDVYAHPEPVYGYPTDFTAGQRVQYAGPDGDVPAEIVAFAGNLEYEIRLRDGEQLRVNEGLLRPLESPDS